MSVGNVGIGRSLLRGFLSFAEKKPATAAVSLTASSILLSPIFSVIKLVVNKDKLQSWYVNNVLTELEIKPDQKIELGIGQSLLRGFLSFAEKKPVTAAVSLAASFILLSPISSVMLAVNKNLRNRVIEYLDKSLLKPKEEVSNTNQELEDS